jgi:hypothetical protein
MTIFLRCKGNLTSTVFNNFSFTACQKACHMQSYTVTNHQHSAERQQ